MSIELELECLTLGDITEVYNHDSWQVRDGDLINLTVGDRTAVIRIEKGKIAYIVIDEVTEGIKKELGEIDLYERE